MKNLLNYLMLLAVLLLSGEGISSIYASEVEDSLSGTKTENVGKQHPGGQNKKNDFELQYTIDNGDETTNSILLTHRNGIGMKDGLIEFDKYDDSLRVSSAYCLDKKKLQIKGFLGGKDADGPNDYFGGVHLRFKSPISSGIENRIKAGYEESSEYNKKSGKKEETSALFVCDKLKIRGLLPFNLELMGGLGEVSDKEGEKHPHGFQVILGKGGYGLGLGLTKTDDSLNSITRNLALFRHASYGQNKYPDFFFFLRDNPEVKKSLKLFGLYYGPGINGGWQLVEPAVYGITDGMIERTWAHPSTYLSNVARFSDINSKFSRDCEDGTVVIIGADFKQDLGGGLEVGAREVDLYCTLHTDFLLINNPRVGLGLSEFTNPAFDPKTRSMKNEKTEERYFMTGFNLLDKYLGKNGLGLGIYSKLTFGKNGDIDDTCISAYLKGLRF